MRLYIPQDTIACALGADNVAAVIQGYADKNSLDIELVRNDSRGAFWLESMLEVESEGKRIAFGLVSLGGVDSIFKVLNGDPQSHPFFLGAAEEIPYLENQKRLSFAWLLLLGKVRHLYQRRTPYFSFQEGDSGDGWQGRLGSDHCTGQCAGL